MNCACKCGCRASGVPGAHGLCADCWRRWCTGEADHQPVADNSYMGVYGLTGIWTGWLISRGAGHVIAEPPAALHGVERPPMCPSSVLGFSHPMVSRPDAWKCYRHPDWIVIPKVIAFPRSPDIAVSIQEEVSPNAQR